jgi:hypothetical protein
MQYGMRAGWFASAPVVAEPALSSDVAVDTLDQFFPFDFGELAGDTALAALALLGPPLSSRITLAPARAEVRRVTRGLARSGAHLENIGVS